MNYYKMDRKDLTEHRHDPGAKMCFSNLTQPVLRKLLIT
jgi:hypothetical protein